MSKFNLMPVVSVALLDGSTSGVREISSLGSILAVRAGPYSELPRIKANLGYFDYITYVIDTPEIYPGHGRSIRNIGDRLEQKAKQGSQVYVIYSRDPRFKKFEASILEAGLINIAERHGVPLANRIRPHGCGDFGVSTDFELLVQHAQILLAVAGFQRFEQARREQSDRPLRVAVTGDLHDLRLIEPEHIAVPADAVLMRLICRDLQAQGHAIGGRFLVLPGADYCYTSRSGLSRENVIRREAIEAADVLERLPEFADRARLPVGLDCKSSAIAVKILTGEHIGNRFWQEIPSPQVGSLS